MQNQKNVPISKTCRISKRKKLLSEFIVDESKNDRHDVICKECISDIGENELGACCKEHFDDMIIAYNYDHFSMSLYVIECLQKNEAEIPKQLLDRMFKVLQRSGM